MFFVYIMTIHKTMFQYVSSTEAMLQERSLLQTDNPYQLVYQSSYSDTEPPFPIVQAPAPTNPTPIIYSLAQSKVKVYRPNEIPTTTTSTTTTSIPDLTLPTPALPSTIPTTARPFYYQTPDPLPPPPPSHHHNPHRPVLFNQRQEGGGSKVSRPFQYLSRLSSFLTDRIFTGRTKKRLLPRQERPQLVTRRTEGSSMR